MKDLRPFPTHISVSYEGHSGMVRAVAVEARTEESHGTWPRGAGKGLLELLFAANDRDTISIISGQIITTSLRPHHYQMALIHYLRGIIPKWP